MISIQLIRPFVKKNIACIYVLYINTCELYIYIRFYYRCRDYVTEQFFNMYNLNMIPVVLGGANYSAIAPPHSYINAADFPK